MYIIFLIHVSLFQPSKEGEDIKSSVISYTSTMGYEGSKVPSKLIIPDIFCGKTSNGPPSHNGTMSMSSTSGSNRYLSSLCYVQYENLIFIWIWLHRVKVTINENFLKWKRFFQQSITSVHCSITISQNINSSPFILFWK